MQNPEAKDAAQGAIALVRSVDGSERILLKTWLEALLKIRASDMSRSQKIRAAIRSTFETKALWPVVKAIATQVRKHGWDERGSKTKWAIVASAIGIALFGGQSAGIAALGGAIGVPLWVVFGGGAAIAKIMLEEIARNQISRNDGTQPSPDVKADRSITADYVDVTPDPDGVRQKISDVGR